MNIDDASFNLILDRVTDGVYITNANLEITFWNSAAYHITGFQADTILGLRCFATPLVYMDERGNELTDMENLPDKVFFHHKNGYRIPVKARHITIRNEAGEVSGSMGFFSIADNANGDRTNYNQCQVELFPTDHMKSEIAKLFDYEEPEENCGIIRFDIDGLESIKVTYGEDIAGRVLTMVSKNIFSHSSHEDIYGHWVNGEFIGIISEVDSNELLEHAEHIRSAVENSYIKDCDVKVSVTLSIGATIIRRNDFKLTLMERLDKLLYNSREAGGNTINLG